jgi:signal transduction histidine kinase
MIKMITTPTHNRSLRLPLILAMIALFIAGLLEITDPSERLIATVLLAAFAIILFTPFFWHSRPIWVHAGLAVESALAAALLTLRPGWNFFPILFFLLSPMAMIYLTVRAGLIWIGLFTLITGSVLCLINGPIGLAFLLPYAAGYVFFAIFGRMTVEAEHNRLHAEQLLAELQAAHQQLQVYATQVEELAIAQERNRIAREMHDTLGHRLTIASVQLEGAQRLIPNNPERAASIIGTVREQVKEGLTDLRRTVAMLRASVEEDLPLDKALHRLVEQVQQATSLVIHLSLENCPAELSLPQHQAIYRAAQEALTNIQRHAQASEVWLQLNTQNNMIELLVSDNGVGFSAEQPRSGFGLLGLKERAELQNGEFHVDTRAGGGTQITFRIPLLQAAQQRRMVDLEERTNE